MTDLFLNYKRRRLPVFFLLDTSSGMDGTSQVIMQDGLLVVKNELARHKAAAEHVFLSGITFGEDITASRLMPLETFSLPTWQAKGECKLEPALAQLVEALQYDLIASRPGNPGDYSPLVFLILGSNPSDVWQTIAAELHALTDNRKPLVMSLVTRPELIERVRTISQSMFLLESANATYLTYFFFWVARTIAKICDACEEGATTVDFPELPFGVVGAH